MHSSGYSHVSSTFQDPASAGWRFLHDTNREIPVYKKKALSAFVPSFAGLAIIVVENFNSFLQRKRNKAMASGLMAIKQDQSLAWNSLNQLENDFLLYRKYTVANLQDLVKTVNVLQNRTMVIERLLMGQDLYKLQHPQMAPDVTGRVTFIHKLNLYVHNMLECQIRLYEWLLRHLKDLLDGTGILSTGHLLPLLYPPSVLNNITMNAISMVHKSCPDYVLAFDCITEYYDMKLATFGVDTEGNMIFLSKTSPVNLRHYMTLKLLKYPYLTTKKL